MQKLKNYDEDSGESDEHGRVEMNLLGKNKNLSHKPGSKKRMSTTSVFARTPVKATETYEQVMLQERSLFLIAYLVFILISPLVFRYAMGSNLIAVKGETKFVGVDNATLATYTDWGDCMSCRDVYGVTLMNLTVVVSNVTSPNPNGRTPSLAVFASQDLNNWYNAYHPKKVQDAFIDNWRSTTFTLFNGTEIACLGGVYHNYLVICLNTEDIATSLRLGDEVVGPPFNDRCFQMEGICGIPCVASDKMPDPTSCDSGFLDPTILSTNKTKHYDTLKMTSVWMSGLNWVEWVVLVTIFFDCFGNVLRYLPVVSGRPTELESARNCLCEGVTVAGCCSPFVSEDEAIFLRSLIGRTATVFHTVGGRHNMHALYIDTILNEKRGKGEANRIHLWLSWLEFITLLARIGVDDSFIDYDEDVDVDDYENGSIRNSELDGGGDGKRNSMLQPENEKSRPSFHKQNSDMTTDAQTRGGGGGIRMGRRSTISYVPEGLRGRASITGTTTSNNNMTQPMETPIIGSDFASLRVNNSEIVNFSKKTRSNSVIGGVDGPTRPSEAKGRQSQFGGTLLDPRITFIKENLDENEEEYDVDNDREIDPFDPEEDLEFDMADLLPLICFLDGWLEAIKDKEWTFNYRNKSDAMESIFNAAPLEVYFQGNDLLLAHNCLKNLYDAFVGDVKDEKDHGMPIHPEFYQEVNWIVCRRGLPNWTVIWSYMSRARLRPMSKSAMSHPPPPDCLFETTVIKPGAIVFRRPDSELPQEDAATNWLAARMATYKVIKLERGINGNSALIAPWPEMKRPNGDPYDDRDPSAILVAIEDISLVEQNRGKAGALNVYKDFLTVKASAWVAQNYVPGPIQIFMGIIDARHMLAEPEIFWNDALPFFARNKESGESAKDYGELSTNQQCIMVQYPQFFTNVTRDDFLDNKNSAYYTIWQTLRDCGKCITSSGTNAIWEITDPTFAYATTSRIEDTGTSQKYIPQFVSVHLPCFVAYGVAKQTEDYIEAVYRWSTGAVELFWSTVSSSKDFSHYILIFFLCIAYGLACFGNSGFWYFLWIIVLIASAIQGQTDKANGHRPLRGPIVSSTIVLNTMYWISNLVSTVWMILIPIQIAFYTRVPLSQSVTRSLFWGFAALLLRLPPAIMTDRIVDMCRYLSLKTDVWNYSMVLWRSSQLYSCSFAYSSLSILTGTSNAFKALTKNSDLTMWSSFRVSDAAFKNAWDKVINAESYCSCLFINFLIDYCNLFIKSIVASFSMPDVLTKWWALFLFTLQVTCIFISVNVTNVEDTTIIFVTIVVCGLNLLLCIDITVLLCPSITLIIGRPARPEYVFAFLGFTVVVSALVHGNTSLKLWTEIVKIGITY